MADLPTSGLQLRSTVTQAGELRLELVDTPVPELKPQDVLLKVEASPINPSDLGLLLGMADVSTAVQGGTAERPTITAQVPEGLVKHFGGRLDQALPVGNEGGAVVIAGTAAVRTGRADVNVFEYERRLSTLRARLQHDGVAIPGHR